MQTVILPFDADEAIERALEVLRAGEPIAFPTDTVYGVGAVASDAQSVLRLYEVKRRPRRLAIPVLLANPQDITSVAEQIPPRALELAQRFWPGGLTLVLPAAPHLPAELLADGSTVAVRVPNHNRLRELITQLGHPLAATSANLHRVMDPMTSSEVMAQLGGSLPLILDGGTTPSTMPSTVVDCSSEPFRIIRQGVIRIDV
ncbi:MAG: threonylcarbamoyl-AMP synthase [Chloroflexaceae bacterium]|nr:threonylcarbamoyl-AMP synthase [Chloroflexaceae bacterium]